MNKKITLLILAISSFLLFLLSALYGFVAFRLSKVFNDIHVQFPLYTQLWIKFWWLLPIIFFTLTIWLFFKYKKTSNKI